MNGTFSVNDVEMPPIPYISAVIIARKLDDLEVGLVISQVDKVKSKEDEVVK